VRNSSVKSTITYKHEEKLKVYTKLDYAYDNYINLAYSRKSTV
jgi:hypothetical protein